ncbi:MAG: hypothetical protein AAFW81_00650 [Pseudomonadota bacterium]
MRTQILFKSVPFFTVVLSAIGCTTSPMATRDIAFPLDPAATPIENYQTFAETAISACKSRDILHIDGIGGEYHCRSVLLDRAVAASGDLALQTYHARNGAEDGNWRSTQLKR